MKITIQSPGLLDLNAIILMGASTKREDNTKIGRFGTGLKYALAYLIRTGRTPEIWVGMRKLEITTEQIDLRGQTYDKIIVDGVPTSMTAQMGPDWELWKAIREIYCNALDEGADTPFAGASPREDVTTFVIPNCEELATRLDYYFPRNAKTLVDTKFGEIIEARPGCIYKQRVLVSEGHDYSFAYNISSIELTEDRIPKESYRMQDAISKILHACDDPAVIMRVANANEWDRIPTYIHAGNNSFMGAAWRKHFQNRSVAGRTVSQFLSESAMRTALILSDTLAASLINANIATNALEKSGSSIDEYLDPTNFQQHMLEEIQNKLKASRIEITQKIQIVRFSDNRMRGLAKDDTIYLSSRCFVQGLQYLLETILEEWCHLEYKVYDETRSMQDALLQIAAQAILKS